MGRILKWESDVPVPDIPDVNFANLVLEVISQYEDRIALVDAVTGRSITYKELHCNVLKLSASFARLGLGLGDAVLVLSLNHIDLPAILLACMLVGATCVPVNPMLTEDELTHVVKVSQAKCAVSISKACAMVERAFATIGSNVFKQIWTIDEVYENRPSLQDLISSGNPDTLNYAHDGFTSDKAVALMFFSSGTTGSPKGVLLSHRNILTVYMQGKYLNSLTLDSGFSVKQVMLLILPMYHSYGFSKTIGTLTSGGQVVLRNGFSPEEYFQTIEKYKVTHSPVVPHIAKFLADTTLMEKYDISSLVAFATGSAPVSSSTLNSLIEKSGKMTSQAYGMTETAAPVAINALAASKPDSVGKVAPYFEVKVVDPQSGQLLGERNEGELWVRGPGVTLGYANNAEATAEILDSEGWLRTGDLFYYDENGFLFITDRIKDIMKVKGYQVAPAEIERVLLELEEVFDVAVTGIPSSRLGEAPRAWLVPTKGASIDKDRLMKHVSDRLPSYKHLAGGVEVTGSLPRNHVGKIDRRQLRNSYKTSLSQT